MIKRLRSHGGGAAASTGIGRPNALEQKLHSMSVLQVLVNDRGLLQRSTEKNKHSHINSAHSTTGKIEVNYGCILIPAVLLVWWYFLRRSISRGLSTDRMACSDGDNNKGSQGSFADNEDEYSTWEEVIENHKLDENSVGFVRWIDNGDNLLGQQQTNIKDDDESTISGIRWAVLPTGRVELDVISAGSANKTDGLLSTANSNDCKSDPKQQHCPKTCRQGNHTTTGLTIEEGVCA